MSESLVTSTVSLSQAADMMVQAKSALGGQTRTRRATKPRPPALLSSMAATSGRETV